MRLNSTSVDPMAVIRVPKTPRTAYNPDRPAGTLLQNQLRHLEWAVRPAGARTEKAFRIKSAATEGDAAARIAKLTEELNYQATAPRDVMPPNPATTAPVFREPPATGRAKPTAGKKPRPKRKAARAAHSTTKSTSKRPPAPRPRSRRRSRR